MTNAPAATASEDAFDIAIVGGGVSGVYSAYRLLTAELQPGSDLAQLAAERPDGKLRVGVFELSGHIGGRLLSATPPDMPNTTVELGGMRYMSTHTYVKALVENKLRLRTRPFPVDEPENLAYLRGQRIRLQDLPKIGQPGAPDLRFDLNWSEGTGDPRDLLGRALDALIPGVTSMDPDTMWSTLKSVEIDGTPIADYGLWNLVAKVLSFEAYTLARAIGGYDCLAMNYNAVNTAIASFEFVPGTTFAAFVDGFHEVPQKLAEMTIAEGGQVLTGKRLRSVTNGSAPGMTTLTFADATVVQAHKVILAMPRRSLELLDPVGPLFDPANEQVRSLLTSVDGIKLFKVFLCYRYPWWEAAGVTQGRSLSDLPIRQTYYWGVEGRQEGADPADTNAVVLASYDDEQSAQFWAGYRNKGAEALFSNEGDSPDHRWEAHQAPAGMVEEAHRQLMELHDVKYAPAPYAASYRDWGEDPFGGAVHLWKIHERSWDVMPAMLQPDPSLAIFVCGEAYSQTQTWVEGALETAEAVLQEKLAVPPPDWMHGRAEGKHV